MAIGGPGSLKALFNKKNVMEEKKKISSAVIRRLPRYYRYLGELIESGVQRISSKDLSVRMKVTASQIRQDLNNFGGFGQQGYGYNVKYLYDEIGKILGIMMMDQLADFIHKNDIEIVALTIPKQAAKEIGKQVADAGIKAIWNFAHTDLNLPDDVIVENVHLSESLMRLSYTIANKHS